MRDFPQNLELEDVKMGAFVRDLPQNQVQTVKMKPELSELSVPMRGRSDHDPSIAETVSQPSAGQASPSIFRDTFCPAKHNISRVRYLSKRHFVRDFPQRVTV